MGNVDADQMRADMEHVDIAAFLAAHRRDRVLTKRMAAFRGAAHRIDRIQEKAIAAGHASSDPDGDPVVRELVRKFADGLVTLSAAYIGVLERIVDLARAKHDQRALSVATWLANHLYGDVDLTSEASRAEAVKRWVEAALRQAFGDTIEFGWTQ